jgi:hypothetical protein
MKRRSLFQLLAGATAAAAMEVCGLLPVRKVETVTELAWCTMGYRWGPMAGSRWSDVLIEKTFPEGMGNTIKAIKSSNKSQNEAI